MSDQDNGIIFGDSPDPDAQRALLLPLARRINGLLANCGFPLCSGAIMASNPVCCLDGRPLYNHVRPDQLDDQG